MPLDALHGDMAFGVFVYRSDSIYEDSPAERYQFPRQYLARVQECVGDWIIYYEPLSVREPRGYFAVARVKRIIPDPGNPAMYLAVIEPGTYLDFADQVPYKTAGALNEQGLAGRSQWAVRPLSAIDFRRITEIGLDEEATLLPRADEFAPIAHLKEERSPFAFDEPRERIEMLTSRVCRDRVFRRTILRAYGERCAVTGLKLINGGGRAEVEAAHIRPVTEDGPDIISNGLALSGTAHWMFDRGLITLSNDLKILVSRQVNDQESVRGMINGTGRALVPLRAIERPHPHFLEWHRSHCFKQ